MSGKIIVAIDGYSGTGKSSTAKLVAKKLNYRFVDSGAMYRAVTLFFIRNGINCNDLISVNDALDKITIDFEIDVSEGKNNTLLNGVNVENEIRGLEVSEKVSEISAISDVRKKMVEYQRSIGKSKGIVMDGRDIGTVVFPNAELKIFMTADPNIRAQRRLKELAEKGQPSDLESVIRNLKERDHIDSTRADSPLVKAENSVVVDTSHLTFEEQVKKIVNLALEKIKGSSI